MRDDRTYYLRRVEQELAAVDCAADPGSAQVHREMAERYRHLLNGELHGADAAQTEPGQAAETGVLYA